MRIAILLALVSVVPACNCNVNVNPGPAQMAATHSETWTIDGKSYDITTTYYMALSARELQYTIEWRCDCPDDLQGITRDRAVDLSLPIMRHAVQNGLWSRTKIGGTGTVTHIGVEIGDTTAGAKHGFRVRRTIQEVTAALEADEESPGTLPTESKR